MQELTKWHDWEVTGFLGRGSYGEVYQIERTAFGHTYKSALKVIRIPKDPQEFDNVVSTGMSEEDAKGYFHDMAESIASEFALMSEFRGNTNIVSFEDFEVVPEEDGFSVTIYIRMELLEPLLHYMRENRMTRDDVIRLGCDMLKALELCENKNIIHRDIKPENVFRSDQGAFKLGDFGIAREMDRTESGMSKKGTISYMAPEVYRGTSYGPNVDIYSLGIMLYRLMNNNRLPFMPPYPEKIKFSDTEQANLKRMTGEDLPLPCNAQDDLGRIILKACKYDPAERYQTAAEMKHDLENYLAGGMPLIPEDDDYEEEEGTVSYPKEAGAVPAAAAAGVSPAAEPVSGEIKADNVQDDKAATDAVTGIAAAEVKADPVGDLKAGKKEKKDKKKEKADKKDKKTADTPAKEKKKISKGMLAGIGASAVVLLLILLVLGGAFKGKVTIGDYEYSKDTDYVMFNNEEVTIEDIQKLDQLSDLEEIDIKDCELDNEKIEALGNVKTGVTKLIITNCHGFDDISPLANMPYLGFLNLSSCDITDDMLSAADFSKCEHFAGLRLYDNPGVTSLDPIKTVIPQLKALSISKTGVSDISALSNAGELQMLLAAECGISDISAVKCKKMKYLNFDRNSISDISVLKDMPDLWLVRMSDNDISDLSPLAEHDDLDTAIFNGNHISDLAPLGKCPHLTTLQACGNEIETLEGLAGHTTLVELYVNDNELTSMKGIENELELGALGAARNKLTDLEGAENFTKLVRVNYEGNSIEDFSLLTKSNDTLQWVVLNDNPVGSLDVLKDMHDLQGVYCDNTGITTLDPIKDKTELMAVSAQNNELTSVDALDGKSKLETVDVSGNKIKDISSLENVYYDDYIELAFDFRDNEIETLRFPDSNDFSVKSYVAVTGNPVSGAELTTRQAGEDNSTGCAFLAMDYYDGLEGEDWLEDLESWTVFHLVGCPLDKQVALKEHLTGVVVEENIQLTDKDDSGAVMDPLLYKKKCHDFTVEVDTTYGKNAVIPEDAEEQEIDDMSSQIKAED